MTEAEPYLTRLTNRLLDGIEKLPAELRQRNTMYLLGAQNPDGGFSGREGGSDLYYTGFALRSLAVLQGLNPDVCGKAANFLRTRMTGSAGVVDFFSLVVSCYLVPLGGGPDVLADAPPDWRDRVAGTLETFRAPDGGYAKTPGAPHGSTYTSFLVTLCLQLLGRPNPEPEKLVRFVKSRRRPDGGYVEISAMKRSGTNPTAAGVGLLQILGELDDEARTGTAEFLAALPSPYEGGLRANDRIPAADLLSTFTGSWTLDQLGYAGKLDWERVRSYAEDCERSSVPRDLSPAEPGFTAAASVPRDLSPAQPGFTAAASVPRDLSPAEPGFTAAASVPRDLSPAEPGFTAAPGGGFRGGLWDDRTDVEYTFYGLGTLALAALQPENS